jgi:hypothetical protein
LFTDAVRKTKDFEPIFSTGIYDGLPIPDNPDFMEYIVDFVNDLQSIDIVKIGDRIGYMYEILIPPEERHS